jgi:homoserine dehydrogenase
MKKVRIGLIGLGTIGHGVAKQLIQNKSKLKKKLNFDLELVKVCDINVKKIHKLKIPPKNFTLDANEIITDPEVDVVIELIGGIHPAKEYILKAIKNKKHIITANKALLAEEGDEIFKEAERNKVRICFEASVGGGIPIVKSIREALISNNISSIMGIVNGTCNYILTSMQDEGLTLKQALVKAQDKGYAERNPKLDIDGIDSAHKLTILTRLAFGYNLEYKEIYVEGINEISQLDISYAKELGYTIKLLAISKKIGNQIEARVHPTLISFSHLLSSIRGIYNAFMLLAI